MSAADSFLSSPKYGYDFVVATTQMGINGTMLDFLNSRQEPTVNICYVADKDSKPVPMAFEDFKTKANGTDPFSLGEDVKPEDKRFKDLFGARFMVGFRAKIGIPKVSDPSKIPDVAILGSNTGAVTFNLFCSEFVIVKLNPGDGYGAAASWFRVEQHKDNPWIFSSKVDLRLAAVADNAYDSLPTDVKEQIKNMSGSAFGVQQLLFDLANAKLSTVPDISGIKPGTTEYMVMQQYFIGAYFTELQKNGQPMLGCAIVPHTASTATLTLTDMNLQVSPYVDGSGNPIAHPDRAQENLATLNYLCAADGNSLPPPVPFTWNWVDEKDAKETHGVLSINRNSLGNYFRQKLKAYVSTVCIEPVVKLDGLHVDAGFKKGGGPTVTVPANGEKVLNFNFSKGSYDEGFLCNMNLDYYYNLDVDFSGNQITIVQEVKTHCRAKNAGTTAEANIVHKYITDKYTLAVDEKGQLTATAATPKEEDKSEYPNVNIILELFTGVEKVVNDVKKYSADCVSQSFHSVPVDSVQSYVFPGGQTFVFKDAKFSNNQDLESQITYADPSRPVALAV